MAGSVNIVQLNKVNAERQLGIRIMTAKDVVEAFLLVESDRAAAFVMDDVQLSILIAQSKDPSAYAISDDAFALPEPYGIMLRKGDAPFKAVVDRATADLYPAVRRSGRSTPSGSNRPCRHAASTTTSRCRLRSRGPSRIPLIAPIPSATRPGLRRDQPPARGWLTTAGG